jgi:glycosyltransferase involved in cell wall biosynthesis
MKLKIAIVVHGRFHAFDLTRELIKQGHSVTLLTNYPKSIGEKFGIPKQNIKTFLLHGILSRIIRKSHELLGAPEFESYLHSLYSRWAAQTLSGQNYDVIHAFSGIAEELFQSLSGTNVVKTLVRGSSHIRSQFNLLLEEEKRAGVTIDKPSLWMIEREEREYQLADAILVLSTFAQNTFLHEQNLQNKIKLWPLGAELERFRPQESIIETRCQRILSKQPLNVLMVGTFSYRKGILDFIDIAKQTSQFIKFTFLGALTPETKKIANSYHSIINFIPKKTQFEIPSFHASADLFIFTTIEDGYAMVLSQAQASGLPILTTENCSGPDIVIENQTGWVLPIRSPEAFIERLNWCHKNRKKLAEMAWSVYNNFQPRDWSDVAHDFVQLHQKILQTKSSTNL